MQKEFKIRRSRLYADTEYSAILSGRRWCGYKLERINLDKIEVTSGEVCFFDPYNPRAARPFTVPFPAGTYRPFMLMITTDKGRRVALAGLDGGALPSAVEWKLALCDERDVIKLTSPDANVGIPIGSGFGAVCDSIMHAKFVRLLQEAEDSFHPLDGVINMDGSCAQLCRRKDIVLPVCNTGWGEGQYRCYLGVRADGTPLGLVCDFDMIPSPPKKDDGRTESFTFDMNVEELYVPDPKKSDAENSIAKYSLVIESDPDVHGLFHAYSRRGYAYHLSGKYAEALADYLRAIAIGRAHGQETDFASHAWSLYDNAALIYRDTGKTAEAIALYREAITVSDTFYGGAYVGLIDIYRENKEYTAALQAADEMVAARPQDPTAYAKRAHLYSDCEDYERAIADFDLLIDKYKLNECILDKALCLSSLGKYKEALKVLDTYLLESRANEVYYDLRAGMELMDNQYAEAYVDARKAYDVNHDYASALEKLIELDGLLFRPQNVAKWATRYIELRPRSEYGYNVRAEAYMQMGEYEDAVADYLYLVQHIKENMQYYALLVNAALHSGDKGLVKRSMKILRKHDNAYYVYANGLLLMHDKKYARAERYFGTAYTFKEEDLILFGLIDCYIKEGKLDQADVAVTHYAEIVDAETAFIPLARIEKARGIPADRLAQTYIERYLGACADRNLTERVWTFFRTLQ